LFERSEESPGVEGLGLLPGEIVRIPKTEGLKIPHMGWNSIDIREGSRLFQGIDSKAYMYFVHSYYLRAKNPEDVAATTSYGTCIHAAVEHENLFACQFHPEKSSEKGLRILKNFASMR
jgi:glutamine amidotransferase